MSDVLITEQQRKAARAKAEELTGEKHCFKCNRYKPIATGIFIRGANGTKRWVCEACAKFVKGRAA